ncbi:uncharacterized protein L969DRAFT_85910 [Mixia osmundae IAM 14324]|uniref:uncharacterized protein n=1 Tax=Mixia osmundae (strain CBS 9802 / IAM 14324 / JCM 22182 / KY 12970) TaxID=764103 RepID=UPI0004A54984|nr:uncharacterized protein L969DRAFT_85910 [Mixia osmundae IAM 14324]KEI40691.1 hypothetical protein L969DRAFT_85910 [Mixia osmundae IAM 14324]
MPKAPRCEEQERRVFPDYTVMQINAVRRLATVHVESDSEIINQVIGFCCSAFVSFTAKAWVPNCMSQLLSIDPRLTISMSADKIDVGEAVYTLTCGGGMRPIPGVGASCAAIFENAVEMRSDIEDKPGPRRAIWTMTQRPGCSFTPVPPPQVEGGSGTA